MSSEIDFRIELREVGGTKRLAFIHDPGQGPHEVVVRLGTETMVLNVKENANAAVAMLRFLEGRVDADHPAAQLRDIGGHGVALLPRGQFNTNGDLFAHDVPATGKHMPATPRVSVPAAVRNPNDK